MIDVVEAWLASGQYAEIAGHKLRPIENNFYPASHWLYRVSTRTFYLKDDGELSWVLKKFPTARSPAVKHLKAIQSLIPR